MLGFVDPYAKANEQFAKQLQQIQQQQPGQDPQQPAPAQQVTPVPQTETVPQEMNVSLLFAFVQLTSDAPQLKGTHGNRANIGGWRENVGHSITTPADSERPKKAKKKTTAFRASIYDAADSPKRSSAKTGSKSGSKKSRTDEPELGESELEGWDNFNDEAAEAPEALDILDDEETFDEPDPQPTKKKKSPGTTATPVSGRATKSKETPAAPKTSAAASPTDQIRSALQAGQVAKALKRYRQQKSASPNWKLDERELAGLCDGLHKAQQWSDAVLLMEECLARFPQTSARIRLKLAAIFAEVQRRPRAALKLLAQVPRDRWPEKLHAQYDKVRKLSQKLIDMNVEDRKG
jgi:hypothetical protein